VPQHFEYEFDESKPNRIQFDYSPDADEQFSTALENGVPFLYLDRSGMLTLAKILKMSMGPYTHLFHVHLHKHFDAERSECLTVILHDGTGEDNA